MAERDSIISGSSKATATTTPPADESRWPLAYTLQTAKQASSLQAFGIQTDRPAVAKKRWWSHTLYRGPGNKPVEILYSKTRDQSESIAQQFVSEAVIGFDMEWPWDSNKRSGLQNKIGLIQIATQEKVALFHIGLHPGKTTNDIIAPTLRRIIESPSIGKIGVCVLTADFARLNRFFGLKPKGAIELSHLHRLVVFGGRRPELVSTKMVSLAQQVEHHLGLPLYKGDVRTSNWSKPLSTAQIDYAAGDAYAGLMLYHCMNAKRLKMKPVPPLPVRADKYMSYKFDQIGRMYLEPLEEGGEMIPSDVFFGVPTRTGKPGSGSSRRTSEVAKSTTTAPQKEKKNTAAALPEKLPNSLDESSRGLYEALLSRRKALADSANVPVYRIAPNVVIEGLVRERPLNSEDLLKIKGVGKHQQEKYGSIWIEIITKFSPTDKSRQEESKAVRRVTPESSPAFEEPLPPRTAQLHTGLSFTFAETALSKPESPSGEVDSSLPSLDFGESPSRRTSGQKRKRCGSPLKQAGEYQETSREVNGKQEDSLEAVAKAGTAESKMFRNKLVAFSKLVMRGVACRRADGAGIVSDETLDIIVSKPPRTQEELRRIAGIEGLMQACLEADRDLLKNIVKFAPVGR